MNKLCYRIVFNKARGMCMAVQETARSRTKAPGQGTAGSSAPVARRVPVLRRMAFVLGTGFGGIAFADVALAQIIADPKAPGQQQATVLNTANGVLQVNVQTPSAAGVSRNVYSQFDVPKSGAILNNSRTNAQTQLGGWVQGNPWLTAGTARVILNEVNSSNPSHLQGYIEVAGDRAETVIANPAGIVVDGGGFINVSRATLTTGSPLLDDGRIKGYSVQRGQILVDGAGLDASKTDYTALIARSLQINAGIWAQRLNVISGVNQVEEAEQATVTQTGQATDGPPLFAIDVSRLGGMYANQIYLVGTEAGVGVRNAGGIGASAGDLVVTANGRLENTGTLSASQKVRVNVTGIENHGTVQAEGTLALTAGNLANAGHIDSGGEALIAVQGDVDNSGGRIEAARIDLTGTTVRNAQGTIVQTGASALAIESSQTINAGGVMGQATTSPAGTDGGVAKPVPDSNGTTGSVQAGTPTVVPQPNTGGPAASTPTPVLADGRLKAQLVDNTAGLVAANGGLVVHTGSLDSHNGHVYVNSLSVSGPIFENAGGDLTVLRGLEAHADAIVNDQGKLLVGGAFSGSFGSFSNRQGLLQAGSLSIDVAGHLDNSAGTLRQLGSDIAVLNIAGQMAMDKATLESAGGVKLRAGVISGSDSAVNVLGDFSADSGVTSAVQGRWTIGGDASLHTSSFDNTGGAFSVARTLNVTTGSLTNVGGTIAAGTDLVVAASAPIDNSGGVVQAARDVALNTSGALLNHSGRIEALGGTSTLSITAAAIDNSDGRIANAGSGRTSLSANNILNGGRIGGHGSVDITAHTLSNAAAGSITSQGNLDPTVFDKLDNTGQIASGGRLGLEASGAELLNQGTLLAQRDIEISAASVDNTSGTIATAAGGGGQVSLHTQSLGNRGGLIQADGAAALDVQGTVDNEAGHIGAGGQLSLSVGDRIEKRSGRIEANGRMLVHGGEISNDGGVISAAGTGASVIEANRAIDNNGLIGANGQLTVRAATLNNAAAGKVSATGDLELAIAGRLSNSGGTIGTAGALNFDQAQAGLVNSGVITAAKGVHLNLDLVDNRGGAINTMQGWALDLSANALDNRDGRLMAGGDATVQVRGDIDNTSGVLQSAGSINSKAEGALHNQDGVIEALGAHGTLTLDAAAIDNTRGHIANVGAGATNVNTAGHIKNSGVIAGNGDVKVTASGIDNSGLLSSSDHMELAVSSVLNNSGTISAAAGLHTDQPGAALKNSGVIVASGLLDLTVASLDNTGGQIGTAAGTHADVILNTQRFGNQSGIVIADRDLGISVKDDLDSRRGLLQAKGQLQLSAGGLVDVSGGSIETISTDNALHLHAGVLLNEGGRIVNAGNADTRVSADTALTNSGQIAGNGTLGVEAATVTNKAGGSMVASGTLALQAHARLENAGTISSGATMSMDETGAALINHGAIVANGDMALHAGTVDNSGGILATGSGSNASLSLTGASLSNQGGSIAAERNMVVNVDGALDNSRGRIAGVAAVQVAAGATILNDSGVVEATGAGATLMLQAQSIQNGGGQIVNVGQGRATITATNSLDNNGLIGGNGSLELHADTLVNAANGAFTSGGAMKTAVGTLFNNAGVVNSGATLDIAAQRAEVRNSGTLVANGALNLVSATLDNSGGQLGNTKGSAADVQVEATNISNRGGVILSDRDVRVSSASIFDNDHGTLQASGSLQLDAKATVTNAAGVIEALDPNAHLTVHTGALDNGDGRIVNMGGGSASLKVDSKLSNRGLVIGNGSLELNVGELENQADGSVAAGANLHIEASRAIANAGAVSAHDGLKVDASNASFGNSGQIVSGNGAVIDAASFDNGGGQLVTVKDQGGQIFLRAGVVANAGGAILADGAVKIESGATIDNHQGVVHAKTSATIQAGGDIRNQAGVVEAVASDATLTLNASSIDNSAGRIANVGTGTTRIGASGGIVNSGTLAGNGSMDLSANAVENQSGGAIAAGAGLDLHVSQLLDNAGTISANGALAMDQAAARISNRGQIAAGGNIALHGASIANNGGQIGTLSGADIALASESTLSNRGGLIAASGNAAINAQSAYDNSQGAVQAVGRLQVTAGEGLTNAGGTLEAVGAASTLDVRAASIDNIAGRIVNAGTGQASIVSTAGIVNSGTIAGSGALAISAQSLQNTHDGTVGAGADLELGVREQLTNAGTITSGGSLHIDQAALGLGNSGVMGAGRGIDITAATISNSSGQLYTGRGSGTAINLRAGGLDNLGGMMSADGLLDVQVSGKLGNNDGTLHGGTRTTVNAGGALTNGSGIIENVSGELQIQALSIDSSGRIVNAGTGQTSIVSNSTVVNSGTIAGNGALALSGQSLQNDRQGTIGSGADLEMGVREQLANAGTITSGGRLHFDKASAGLTNSGSIGAGGNIDLTTSTINNSGGQLYTASGSGSAINLRTGSLENSSGLVSADGQLSANVSGNVNNDGGALHGETDTTFNAGGALANGSGIIESASGALAIQAQSIESSGRIVNAGTDQMTIASTTGIVNSGIIAGNGGLALAAQTFQNVSSGALGSGADLDLGIGQQLANAGSITGGGKLRFNQASASLINNGRIGTGGAIDITAGMIDNRGGLMYTASNSAAGISLHTVSLDNANGVVSADGLLDTQVSGNVSNQGGKLHGGVGTKLNAGGTLANGGGTIESGAGTLAIQAQSIDSSGRIVNAGTGQTSVVSTAGIVNSGTIAGNGTLDLYAPSLQNQVGGQIASGGSLLLCLPQQLSNAGTISSGGTLRFEQAGASFANSGQLAAAGDIHLSAASIDNTGGEISTVRGSGADIQVAAPALNNRRGAIIADGDAILSLASIVDNTDGTLQAGRNLALTTSGTIGNDRGTIATLGGTSALTISGSAIDNGSGRISNAGIGDTRLVSQTSISNGGVIAGLGNVLLSAQSLSNLTAAQIASGNNLELEITRQVANQGKVESGGTLHFEQTGATLTNSGELFAGRDAVINASMVNNDGGHLGTVSGSGASLTLTTPQLSNQGGRIATDGDLSISTHMVASMGELFGGRDLALAMDGDYVQGAGDQQVHANRNLSVAVTGNITNTAAVQAGGTLTLSGQQISNQAGASMEGKGVVLRASGNLSNSGEIHGVEAVDISAANVSNSSGIVGGIVTVVADNLNNSGATALIGATGGLGLGVAGAVNNTGGAILYSSGDMVIGGRNSASAGAVNNISSSIEAAGELAINANSLSNVRENVQIVKVKTVDQTVHMTMPGWYQYGDNHNSFETSAANYSPHEVYFVNPSDILDDQVYVTPDGNTIHRALIRTHANDSAFYVAASGLYSSYGEQSRLTLSEGTQVIYYTDRAQVGNPDQGASSDNAIVGAGSVTHWASTITFSNQYGNCISDCIRLVTQPDYASPDKTILRDSMRALAPVKEQLEVSRDAHYTAVEDQLAPGAGANAQILSGGNMYLTVPGGIENMFGEIKAKGALIIANNTPINNTGATLYRTYNFDGTWTTYGGQTVAYQQPSLSEVIGSAAGVVDGEQGVMISARSFNNIDITAGTVGNIRDALNVIGSGAVGASTAGLHIAAGAFTGGAIRTFAVAGDGADGAAGMRVTAAVGTAGTVGDNVEGSASGANIGLAGAVSAARSGSGLRARPTAVAGGIVSQLDGSGHVTGDGYANGTKASGDMTSSGATNELVTNGVAHESGITNEASLSDAVSMTRNGVRLGNVSTGTGPSARQQAGAVPGTALGNVTRVAPSGLFILNPDANGSYVFETRPQFADQQQWTSSDYMLRQLAMDPTVTQKRLGDGFYEQRMVREQLADLTGHAAESGASDDDVYKQLLTNGVSFAQEYKLRPGVALSAEQISHLTSDIAWMESQTVMLPDGSTETVLAPKVYLSHVEKHNLQPGGALVTGNGVQINTTESIVNTGGVVDGGNGRTLLIAGQDIVNRGGTIKSDSVALLAQRDVKNESLAVTQTYDFRQNSGSYTSLSNQASVTAVGALDIQAGRDLSDLAGKISAGSANLTAGRNISFGTIQTGSTYQSQISGYTEKDNSITHQLSQLSTGGDLKMAAKGDLSLAGTKVSVGTAGSGTGQLLAGGTINIAAVTSEVNTSVQNDPNSKKYDTQIHANQTLVGADVAASGSLTVGAGLIDKGAINVTASSLTAGDALKLTATDSVNIVSAQESHLSDTALTRSSSSFLKSKTTQQADYVASSQAIGSALSGKTIDISADKDINVLGSALAGDGDVNLVAKGSVTIGASTSTVTEQHHMQVKENGFLSGNGFGFSIGTRTTTTDQSRDATMQSGQSRSMVGSIGGNLNITADDAIKVSGSDLSAGLDMKQAGRSVTIDPGLDKSKDTFKQVTEQNGLTLAIGGSVVNAIQTVPTMRSAAEQVSTGRFKALAAASAAMTVKDTAQDLVQNGPSAKISLTVGQSRSETSEVTASSTHSGSVLTAGNNVIIKATGGDKVSNIDIVGSDVHAKGNVSLTADNQINLLAAQDTESQHSQTKSMSTAVGLSAELSLKGPPKIGVTASASASRGNVDGEGTTQVNSHVSAGDQLTIASGGDTNVKGAVASGNQVVADVKGNLNIESVQDTATLDGKRQSASVSGTLGAGAGLGASVSQSSVHNDYANVQEQSALRAGDGGFQVQVAGITDLKGGVISSSEQAIKDGRNSLATGSLSFSDVQNRSSTDASGISLGVNVGKNQNGSTFSPSMAPGIGKVSDRRNSVTWSGVSSGVLTVADQPAGQMVASLNRDVSTGKEPTQTLTKGWNGAKALDEVGAQMQITSAAMPRLANEIGNYAAVKAAELSQSNPKEAEKWSEGGAYRIAAHAVLGAMGGGLEGALGAGSSAAAAPFIGKTINALNLPDFTRQAAITALGAGIGAVIGGTAGAVTGADQIANNYLRQHGVGIKKSEQAQFDYVVAACNNGDQSACERRDNLIALSQQRDRLITNTCASGPSADCSALISSAMRDGNKVIFGNDGKAYVYPFGSAEVGPIPNGQDGTVHDQLAKSTLDAMLMASGDAALAKVASLADKGVVAVVDVVKLLRAGSSVGTGVGDEALATVLNNMHRDGAPAELMQQTFNQAALSSTHNPESPEVILGKFIKDSVASYDAVARARQATYFSMSDWGVVEGQLGADQMWNVNKTFLDQQIAQGKTFLFTGDPASPQAGYFTKLEFAHLRDNGYVVIQEGRFYRAVKK